MEELGRLLEAVAPIHLDAPRRAQQPLHALVRPRHAKGVDLERALVAPPRERIASTREATRGHRLYRVSRPVLRERAFLWTNLYCTVSPRLLPTLFEP